MLLGKGRAYLLADSEWGGKRCWPSHPPGQPVFPFKPQMDLSRLAAVSLLHLCSQTGQGQAYKVSPVTSLFIFWGLRFSSLGLWQNARLWSIGPLSIPKVSHQPSLSFLLLRVPDPWLRGRQTHSQASSPTGAGGQGEPEVPAPSGEGRWRHRLGSHPSSLSAQHRLTWSSTTACIPPRAGCSPPPATQLALNEAL